jgi:hypothetical protein
MADWTCWSISDGVGKGMAVSDSIGSSLSGGGAAGGVAAAAAAASAPGKLTVLVSRRRRFLRPDSNGRGLACNEKER